MADTLPVWFARKFSDQVTVLAQQHASRLMSTIRWDPQDIEAERAYYDRIGAVTMQENTDGYGDTEWSYPSHTRRRISITDYDIAIPITKTRRRRIINDPRLQGYYARLMVSANNRKMDDTIIAALDGNAIDVSSTLAETNAALPSGQKVAVGSTGLTLAKLQAAKEILDGNEIDDGMGPEERYLLLGSHQLDIDLLGADQIRSADYNAVKALVRGEVNTFMGFTFIRTERLTVSGTTLYCLAYTKSGMGGARGQAYQLDVAPRPDKKNVTQLYGDAAWGVTRIEDEKVVQIGCLTTST